MFADPPRRKSHGGSGGGVRAKSWPGLSTNEPSLKADDVILVESKDFKESKNKQTLSYGMIRFL